jgi:hypothetical protein
MTPYSRFKEFLHMVATKNVNRNQDDQYGGGHQHYFCGLSSPQLLINLFSVAASQMDQTLLSEPVQCFPFHCLFMRDSFDFDESLLKMDRIGGSFTHLETELSDHLKPFEGQTLSEREQDTFLFAKDLFLIMINGIVPELEKYTQSLDMMYLNHRKLHDLTEQGKIEKSSEIINEMNKIVRTKLAHHRLLFQNDLTRDGIVKFSHWLLQLVNYIDSAMPDLVYMLPDHIISIPFEVLRMIKRESETISPDGMPAVAVNSSIHKRNLNLNPNNNTISNTLIQVMGNENFGKKLDNRQRQIYDSFYNELVTFISKHFLDDRIANPDLKEMYLVRMNILLQHNCFIRLFEAQSFAQENLIQMLMKSFSKNINLRHVTKNLLRLAKGQGFKEIVYEEKVEKTSSPIYLYKLRVQLMSLESTITKEFMNSFFNSLNDVTSELIIVFKELKNNQTSVVLRKTKQYFEITIDLLRMAELFTTWCPEMFLDMDHVHSTRLLNFLMFVLNTVFVGELNTQIDDFSSKVYSHSDNLAQFLAPIVGIFSNIYMGVNQFKQEGCSEQGQGVVNKYESLSSLFEKTDAFNEKGIIMLE